jgi:hypothetical protein
LNFIWEVSQALLYPPHYLGISGLVTVHLRASLGDVLIISIILALDAIILTRAYADRKIDIKKTFIDGWYRTCIGYIGGKIRIGDRQMVIQFIDADNPWAKCRSNSDIADDVDSSSCGDGLVSLTEKRWSLKLFVIQ